ncbi:DUF2752 domain-containing protein [Nocardioides marmoribigeumensis]|uniref:DUF2752 domain-containing protein n=1 Tax=Nocardioides marmoribigeumensis TaxID=433649 RepID=A0ABU2BRH3_9ACTN|nr:DUF2752 domain-containing protein [Nocardioides marmoribigeumensis]MDR7361240.1 hypothetical protein [Nocardioides marmoribigeumensis]
MSTPSAPVPLTGPRLVRLGPPLALAALLLGASVVLHLRDPHQQGSYGFCPWLALTGTYCPGCGGLRAVNDLTHLRVADAASSNLLFVSAVPLLAAAWLRSLHQRWRGALRPWPPARLHALSVVAGVLVVAFWVVRNLPFAGWLTP